MADIPDPTIPNWVKLYTQYDETHFPSGRLISASEWNALFRASTSQGNYLTDTLDLLINIYLPEKWEILNAAVNTADIAEANSVTAVERATNAVANANAAVNTADTAKEIAQSISGIAENAFETASNAEETAQNAANTVENILVDYYTRTETDDLIKALIGGADEAFDTLKEIQTWIENDETGTTELIGRVNANETAIANLDGRVIPADTPNSYFSAAGSLRIGLNGSATRYATLESSQLLYNGNSVQQIASYAASGMGLFNNQVRLGHIGTGANITDGISYTNNNTGTTYSLENVATKDYVDAADTALQTEIENIKASSGASGGMTYIGTLTTVADTAFITQLRTITTEFNTAGTEHQYKLVIRTAPQYTNLLYHSTALTLKTGNGTIIDIERDGTITSRSTFPTTQGTVGTGSTSGMELPSGAELVLHTRKVTGMLATLEMWLAGIVPNITSTTAEGVFRTRMINLSNFIDDTTLLTGGGYVIDIYKMF